MRLFESELDILEETKGTLVLQERPLYVAGSMLLALGVCLALAGIHKSNGEWVGTLVVVAASLSPLGVGAFAFIQTLISLDVKVGGLRIRRTVFGIKIVEQHFSSESIKEVSIRTTSRGEGLRIELKDGKRKRLTIGVGYNLLHVIAARMNQLIRVRRRLIY